MNIRYDIELFRVISSFGIVWLHSKMNFGGEIAYSGLIYFVVVSSYLSFSSVREKYIANRAKRLLIPFFSWYVIYAVIRIIKGENIFPENYTIYSIILASPSVHLWYLPFVFLFSVSIYHAKKKINARQLGLYKGC
ncbi:MAG: hypothetical protein D3920_09740 [Candidatus Electrothrix sp. AW2]|nr:hypothetical protein [Candidatus Electrothrix gigas]